MGSLPQDKGQTALEKVLDIITAITNYRLDLPPSLLLVSLEQVYKLPQCTGSVDDARANKFGDEQDTN